jgi:hypothetical protein
MAEAVLSSYPASSGGHARLGFRTVVNVPLRGRESTIGVLSARAEITFPE